MSLEAVFTGVAFVAGVLAILATVLGSSRRLGRRIDAVDEKLTARIDAVGEKLTARIDAVEEKLTARIDSVEEKLAARIDAVDAKAAARSEAVEQRAAARSDAVEQKAAFRSDTLEAKLDRYHDELVEFRIETKESFGRVAAHLARHDERLALWERFVWARPGMVPEPHAGRFQGADAPQVEPQESA